MALNFPVHIQTKEISSGSKKTVYYPQVADLDDPSWQQQINQVIVQQTQGLIDEQNGNMPETVVEMLGYYEIKNNQRQVLSLQQTSYAYHDRAAHGMTFIKSLTFDMKAQKICMLKDLFKPGSRYMKRLNDLIREQIKERRIDLISKFNGIRSDQDFYLADRALVIYFQLYEFTPYVFGFPMFPISVYDLTDLIAEEGPLGRLSEHN